MLTVEQQKKANLEFMNISNLESIYQQFNPNNNNADRAKLIQDIFYKGVEIGIKIKARERAKK